VTARILGIPKQTLSNWVRLAEKGELQGPGDRPVSAEQMELARLRAELVRVKMERDILKKWRWRTSRRHCCEVRLDRQEQGCPAGHDDLRSAGCQHQRLLRASAPVPIQPTPSLGWRPEGWLYQAAVIDLFSRQVVGWSKQPNMQASLVTDALRMAWFRRHPAPGLIFHSDRGSQYCSYSFQDALTSYGMRSSMSRKGNCWDNAPTESLWGSLKVGG